MLNYKKLEESNTETSDKPWAVLIHGLFGSLDNLNNLARSLAPTTRCLLIDLPNHGDSKTLSEFHFDSVCEQIDHLLTELSIKDAHFIGHSLGGKIALHMGLKFPNRCISLVAADIAPVKYPHRHQAVFDGLQNVELSTLENRAHAHEQLSEHVKEPSTQQFLLKGLFKNSTQWSWRFRVEHLIDSYDHIRDWHDNDSVYQGPTLFIIGGNSDYVLPEHQKTIKRQFPEAKAKIIQGTGHWLHAEKPTIFNKIVNAHIQSVETKI